MKFWVKAIVDENVQEQLLINADSTEELTEQLENLLHIKAEAISVDDFQSQVVDELKGNTDIITIRIQSRSAFARETSGVATEVANAASSLRPTVPEARADRQHRSARISVSGVWENDGAESTITVVDPPTARTPSGLWHTAFDVDQSLSTMTPSKGTLMDIPSVQRVCLIREDIQLLLHKRFNGEHYPILIGCFVRVLEESEYMLFQIASVLDDDCLLIDTTYSTERRELHAVSNAPPAQAEINAWIKKMLSTSRSFPTQGFIEAKLSDATSALEAAKAALEPPEDELMRSVSVSIGGTSTLTRKGRLPTMLFVPCERRYVRCGRLTAKVNDVLTCISVRAIAERDQRECRIVVFATRRSNAECKKPRMSDYSGCILSLDRNGSGLLSDRDVTEKGFEVFCFPQRWHGEFVSLGQIQPIKKSDPYRQAGSDSLLQDVVVLSGRSIASLYHPIYTTSLPIPSWAQSEDSHPCVMRPTLVEHRGNLHVFYLVRREVTEVVPAPPLSPPASRPPSPGLSTACFSRRVASEPACSPPSNLVLSGAAATVPLSKRSSTLVADIGTECGTHDTSAMSDKPGTGDGLQPCTGSFMSASSVMTPMDGPFPFAANTLPPVRVEYHYGLAHAITDDRHLQNWRLLNDEDPLLSSANTVPVFSVASVPSMGSCTASTAAPTREDGTSSLQSSTFLPVLALTLVWHAKPSNQRASYLGQPNSANPSHVTVSPSGERNALPYHWWVNLDADSRREAWTHEVRYTGAGMDVERLPEVASSISLFSQDKGLFLTAASFAGQKLSLWTVPVLREP